MNLSAKVNHPQLHFTKYILKILSSAAKTSLGLSIYPYFERYSHWALSASACWTRRYTVWLPRTRTLWSYDITDCCGRISSVGAQHHRREWRRYPSVWYHPSSRGRRGRLVPKVRIAKGIIVTAGQHAAFNNHVVIMIYHHQKTLQEQLLRNTNRSPSHDDILLNPTYSWFLRWIDFPLKKNQRLIKCTITLNVQQLK